jgi:polyisoprenoid-binding protein YceI
MTATTIPPVPFADTGWLLDPGFSTAEFRVRTYWGLTTVHGHFAQFVGGINPAGGIWLVIDATSLDTGNARRDHHLRSADFFDCEHHPRIEFRSTEVRHDPSGRLQATGQLDAAGRCMRLQLEATVEKRANRLRIAATTTIDQRQLGMTNRRLGIRVPATVTVRALLAPDADPGSRPGAS